MDKKEEKTEGMNEFYLRFPDTELSFEYITRKSEMVLICLSKIAFSKKISLMLDSKKAIVCLIETFSVLLTKIPSNFYNQTGEH